MSVPDEIGPEQHPSVLGRHLTRMTEGLAFLGGLLILGTASAVTVSIALRFLAGGGFGGDFEIVQIATAVTVFAFLPLCAARRGNIFVNTLTSRLPVRVQRGLDALWDLTFAVMAILIAWRLLLGAADTISSRTVSMVLGLPTGWAIAACGVMAVLLGIVALASAKRLLWSSE